MKLIVSALATSTLLAGILIGSQLRPASAGTVPCVQPTALPSSVLLSLSGNGSKQSATFKAPGTFTVRWTLKGNSTYSKTLAFSLTLYDAKGTILQSMSSQKAGVDSSVSHSNCSKGCYLDVSVALADYQIVVTK